MNTRIPCASAPLSALLLSLLVACGATSKAPESMTEAELMLHARAIHGRVITLDTHCDFRLTNFTAERNYSEDLDTQVNLPKMESGGLDVAWLIVYTGQGELTDEGFAAAYDNAKAKFAAIHRLVSEYAPERIELALTSQDVRRIAASGKKVAMIGIENAYPVGRDLTRIDEFHALGGRYMSLSHNGHSQFCDSNTGERDDVWLHGGLSELGKSAIESMNRVGIMIDLSHPAKTSNLQTMQLSRAPVIASHSSARAMNDVSRNLDDEELRALGKNGGVVQTVAFRSYLASAKDEAHRSALGELRASLAAEMGIELLDRRAAWDLPDDERMAYEAKLVPLNAALEQRLGEISAPPVDVADFIDHLDYLVELIGIDHVGISSDFDGGGGVEGWDDASETLAVTLELVRRGYSEEEIAQLWSGNLLRVLDEVQAVAARIQSER